MSRRRKPQPRKSRPLFIERPEGEGNVVETVVVQDALWDGEGGLGANVVY